MARFLGEGHKVKITIMFRGREVFHPELGKRILDRIAEQMGDAAKVEAEPRLDGRNMVMVLAPGQAGHASRPPPRRRDGTADEAAGRRDRRRTRHRPEASRQRPWRSRATVTRWPATEDASDGGTDETGQRMSNAEDEDGSGRGQADQGDRHRRLRRRKAIRSHLLEKKSSVRTRRLGRETDIAKGDERSVRRMLGL